MVYLVSKEVKNLVKKVAKTLDERTYIHKRLVLLCIMNGAFMFTADLVRELTMQVDMDFIHVHRGYGIGTPGRPTLLTAYTFKPYTSYILVDVVAEKGDTFEYVKSLIPKPAEVITCALISKGVLYTPDVFGTRINTTRHLQGYGMGPRRELPTVEGI